MRFTGMVAILLAGFFILSSCSTETMTGIEVKDVWLRHNPMADRPSAIYLKIINNGAEPVSLVAASSPVAGRIMIHRSTREAGVVSMHSIETLMIAPGTRVEFLPGGSHLMVFDLAEDIEEGQEIPLILEFASGEMLQIDVLVCSLVATGMC